MAPKLLKVVSSHKLLVLFLVIGAILRWVNLAGSMSFFYDQARDLLAARAILSGHFVLVGPTTDMPGIFFGPLWFYFLAFLSLLTSGDPVIITMLVSLLDLVTIVLIYLVGKEIFDRKTGLLASFFWVVFAAPVAYARTLASPGTTALWSLLCVLSLLKLQQNKPHFLLLTAVSLGVMFQFNPASAFLFSFFVIAVVFLKLGESRKSYQWVIISGLIFLLFFLPQIIYELRNSFPEVKAISRIFTSPSHQSNYLGGLMAKWENLQLELSSYTFFSQKPLTVLISLFALWSSIKKGLLRKKFFFLWLSVPLFAFFFLYPRGESHPHYLLSWIPAAIFLLSSSLLFLASRWKYLAGLVLAILLILNAVGLNKEIYLKKHFAQPADPNPIGLADEINVVDYIYHDAAGQPFGYHNYGIVPYWQDAEWQYLFVWYGQKKYGYLPSRRAGNPLYLIYEPDPFLPLFEKKWLEEFRSPDKGPVIKTVNIAAYTVEKFDKRLITK